MGSNSVAKFLESTLLLSLRGLSYFYGYQPRKIQLLLGKALGKPLSWLKLREKVIQENLKLAFPQQKDLQNKLKKDTYENLGNVILETLLVLGPLKDFITKNVDFVGVDHWRAAHQLGKGVLFLSSHIGNWEIMAATGSLKGPIDLMLVTKRVKPFWFHQAIEKGRMQCNVKATYEPKTFRDVLSHLKKGGTVGFVLDQYAGPPVGVRVPFFGVPVGTPQVVATLAKRTGAPVVPVVNYRKPDGRWVVEIFPALEWKTFEDPHYELAANTAEYAAILEKHVLKYPEQWLWTHRRFKGDLSPLKDGEWNEPRTRR